MVSDSFFLSFYFPTLLCRAIHLYLELTFVYNCFLFGVAYYGRSHELVGFSNFLRNVFCIVYSLLIFV